MPGIRKPRPNERRPDEDDEDDAPRFAVGRAHAAFLGAVTGGGFGAVFVTEWLEDPSLIPVVAGGGAIAGGVAAALFGDKIWEMISDWV